MHWPIVSAKARCLYSNENASAGHGSKRQIIMARKLQNGNVINGYRIEECVNSGAMALSYSAKKDGSKVFLKQYKSPSVSVGWYKEFTLYQREIKQRIEMSVARQFTYDMLEFFECRFPRRTSPPVYYQVFEWVDTAEDMEKVLEQAQAGSFEQRVIIAKVMMNAIHQLHMAGVIHCDLKPANIIMIKDPAIQSGYRVKLIDMDFSILSNQKAPWHDDPDTGYVGTPEYFSPEHLTEGQAPVMESDIFTCGLILSELLADKHPYADCEDIEQYARSVKKRNTPQPTLAGKMPPPATNEAVENVILQCLDPKSTNRPSAKDVVGVLNGRSFPRIIRPDPEPESVPNHPETILEAEPREDRHVRLDLIYESGGKIEIRVNTDIGQSNCTQFGEDAMYWSDPQFSLERESEGWFVSPYSAAKNETLLNGRAINSKTKLNDGDQLGAGKEERNIIKLPLQVHFS